MKTMLVALLGSVALCACARMVPMSKTQIPVAQPPAGTGFCVANNGILLLVVNNQGELKEFRCPQIKGRPIKQLDARPPGVDIKVRVTDLGEIVKFRAAKETDPCIDWVANGQRSYLCWDQ